MAGKNPFKEVFTGVWGRFFQKAPPQAFRDFFGNLPRFRTKNIPVVQLLKKGRGGETFHEKFLPRSFSPAFTHILNTASFHSPPLLTQTM